MAHPEQQRFDAGYAVVRQKLLAKKMSLKQAKDWLRTHGIMTAVAMQSELDRFTNMIWKNRPDRELDMLAEEDEDE